MRKKIITLMAAFGAIILAVIAANVSFFWIVDHAIEIDVNRRTERWAGLLTDDVPEFHSSLQSGSFSAEQIEIIDRLLFETDIFAFSIYGGTVGSAPLFERSLPGHPLPPSIMRHDSAVTSASSGPEIVVNNAQNEPFHSGHYAVVKHRLKGDIAAQQPIAVIYIDQSGFTETLKAYSIKLAIALTILFTVVPAFFAFRMIRNSESAKQSHERLKFLALRDPLTELYNRNGFHNCWHERFSDKSFTQTGSALLFIDIDNFKQINDNFSHSSGDAYIKHVGDIVAQCMKPKDFAARLGGDEFALAIRCDSRQSAEDAAEKLCALAAKPVDIDGGHIHGSLSVGIHFSDGEIQSLEERMKMADFALHQAKTAGRATYRNYSEELAAKARRRNKVENALNQALSNDYFYLVFQPKICAKNGNCLGFEALLRMRLPGGEIVSPAEFIPIMEDMGLAEKVGSWVLKNAAQAAVNWPEQTTVSVNLSARQVTNGNLVEVISAALEETGLLPERLELEVTESLLIDAPEAAERDFVKLRKMGVTVSIDDFGTGYSSLGYLWRFGFDKIKIDRSFVLGLDENRARTINILETIIMLGHRLGMCVITEGVETEEHIETLKNLGVDSFQGFYFSKPIPEEDVAGFLTRNRLAIGSVTDLAM